MLLLYLSNTNYSYPSLVYVGVKTLCVHLALVSVRVCVCVWAGQRDIMQDSHSFSLHFVMVLLAKRPRGSCCETCNNFRKNYAVGSDAWLLQSLTKYYSFKEQFIDKVFLTSFLYEVLCGTFAVYVWTHYSCVWRINPAYSTLYTSCQPQLKNDYTPHEPDIETVNNTRQMCKARGKVRQLREQRQLWLSQHWINTTTVTTRIFFCSMKTSSHLVFNQQMDVA